DIGREWREIRTRVSSANGQRFGITVDTVLLPSALVDEINSHRETGGVPAVARGQHFGLENAETRGSIKRELGAAAVTVQEGGVRKEFALETHSCVLHAATDDESAAFEDN
ncbi:hypothetical protein X777_03491, partial [Ooceraea biroi]